jgi:hypothetical protein
MKLRHWPVMSALVLALVLGCASQPKPPAHALTGDPLQDGQTMIEQGPRKDRVLWQYRTALVAMRRGQFGLARQLLDDALLTLGGSFGADPSARKARGYFHEEAKKTFLGEPYERVMAYVYRGILYWMDGEPDNARACFRSAQLQDADAETGAYASDYVLLDYMDGLATARLGGDGSDAFRRAQALSKLSQLPNYDLDANVIVFVEFGAGPLKYATGQYGEELRFRSGQSPVKSARLKTDGLNLLVAPTDDLFYQATTRGGRVMDHILGNKAVFKEATDTAGNVALIGGLATAGLSHSRDAQIAGLGVAAAGLLSKIVSAATTPAADTRCWDNLPQYLSFALVTLPPGTHTLTVEFLNRAGQVLGDRTKTFTVTVPPAPRTKVIFVSDQSSTPQTL